MTESEALAVHSLDQVRLARLPDEPEASWPETPDGIAIKGLHFPTPGIVMGQHAHSFGHSHLVGSGALRVWVEGKELGDFAAGQVIYLQAGKRHTMMSLKAETWGFCITNTAGLGAVVARSEFPQ
jgi:quercetin dioxygenase-like cupin family protein